MGILRAAVAAVGAALLTCTPVLAEPVLRATAQAAAEPEHLEAPQDPAPQATGTFIDIDPFSGSPTPPAASGGHPEAVPAVHVDIDIPTPPKPNLPPLSTYGDTVLMFLETAQYQSLIGIGVLAAGIVMLINGEASFKYVVLAFTFLCVGTTTHYELTAVWSGFWCYAGACEAGFLGAYIIYEGYPGAKILMGTALGMLFGLNLLEFTKMHVSEKVFSHPGTQFFVCTALVILGVLAFTKLHRAFLSILAPILGGLLVSSSIGFGVAFTTTLLDQYAGYNIDVRGSTWVEFFRVLISSESPRVGVIGTNVFKLEVAGTDVDLDRVLGYALWAVVTLVGIIIHRQEIKKEAAGLSAMVKK